MISYFKKYPTEFFVEMKVNKSYKSTEESVWTIWDKEMFVNITDKFKTK